MLAPTAEQADVTAKTAYLLGAHDGRESRVVSSDRGDGENDRLGDDEGVAPRPRKRAASFAPGIVAIRTGGETGARENDFRIEPDGGCYWLDW